jgi:hypothetical protein
MLEKELVLLLPQAPPSLPIGTCSARKSNISSVNPLSKGVLHVPGFIDL